MNKSRAVALALCILFGGCASLQPPGAAVIASPTTADAQAEALFDELWQWTMREFPGFATAIGDHRYDDRLKDESAPAVAARRAFDADARRRLAAIDEARLSEPVRRSLQVLRFRLDRAAELTALYGSLPFGPLDDWSPVTQMDGIHLDLAASVDRTRFASVADHENFLQRLRAVPTRIEQLIARMETARQAGWMPPKVALLGVPAQLDAQTHPDPEKSPEYLPFKSFAGDVPAADRERLAAAAREVIRDRVVPAFRALKSYYENRYLPAARDSLDASGLPAGPAYYQALLNKYTSTSMTARQIHELGLREVARIGAQMDEVMGLTGFKGTRAEFDRFLTTDPQFFHTRREDMLAGYRDIAKRADAELPRLFAVLPRLPYGVRAMRPEEGNNAEHYSSGSGDGSRAGFFEANVNDLSTRTRWTMETLLLHEAVPGHHLQTARAQEMPGLPAFRRHLWFTAFGEGWALYAESLGDEMGFYKDPYQKFGNLSYEMLRACRLVVDTGLHAFGWSRQQAIDYMVEHSRLTRADVSAEVDRYIVWPGQATAYKIGELKIKELRAKARAALGERFDLRRFHNAVIDGGALPLNVLEAQIDEWIAAEIAAPR